MLELRIAAANNDILKLERLSNEMGECLNVNEPGLKTGKTAAHFAAKNGHFKAIYWLFEKKADFFFKDKSGKTPIDYLQEKEFTVINPNSVSKGDRQYYLCNAHCKIWLAHDPDIFMPYLYQNDFREYREKNPNGYISLIYSRSLLNDNAYSELKMFAKKFNITLISFEKDFLDLLSQYGTEEDKACYGLAVYEFTHYPNKGGNLAVVADLIRWSSILLRKGSYSDTDVEIGQHKWTNSIIMEKSVALNLGSLITDNRIIPWLNGDIIAVSSLFPQAHDQGDFRITLSNTACTMLKNVQSSLIFNCENRLATRLSKQRFLTSIFSDISLFLQDYFKCLSTEANLKTNFSSQDIEKIIEKGLELFSKEEKESILERMATLMRKRVEKEYEYPELAHKHSRVFHNVKLDEHEKFLKNYMQAILMTNIKESIKNITGSYVFSGPVWECIGQDNWEKYSIYSNKVVESSFRSTNTVKFNTDNEENEKALKTQKFADLSFTPFGMEEVMERSQKLREEHLLNNRIAS